MKNYGNSLLVTIILLETCSGQNDTAILKSIFDFNMDTPTESKTETVRLPLQDSKPTSAPVKVPRAPIDGTGSGKPCGFRKECTLQYFCSNGKVNIDGGAIIDMRFGDDIPCPLFETCCSLDDKVEEPIVSPPYKPSSCGYRNADGVGVSITEVHDNEAQFGEFPWMVAIMLEEVVSNTLLIKYHRGGSLITPQVVLTAAHCVEAIEVNKMKVRAGEWEPHSKKEPYPHQDRKVAEKITHRQFNRNNSHNNIALLFLDTPFELTPNVNTICLPPIGFKFDHSRCFASGWGKDKFIHGQHVNILKKIQLSTVPHEQCQRNLRRTRLSRYFQLHSSFMCAGGERGKDTCTGDGGSPLICPIEQSQNIYYQAGIVAWGIGCGEANIPGVYVSVSELRGWIDLQLKDKDIDSLYFTL